MRKNSSDAEMKKQFQEALKNIYCLHCRKTVPIVDYDVWTEQGGVVIKGKCGLCGDDVSRFIEVDR